jgi:hypothetical protein
MKEFLKRLSSRKLILTVIALIVLMAFPEVPAEFVYLIMTYLGVEGVRDIVEAIRRPAIRVKEVERDIALITSGETPANLTAATTIQPGN